MFGAYRTFLALLVVALHLGGVPSIGGYAVFGFYSLSGYLMTFIMLRNYGYTAGGRYKYTFNRLLRIFPMYWISLLLSILIIFWIGEEKSSAYHIGIYLPGTITEILKNAFLLFPMRELPRLTPPAWALTVEIFFYILIGLGLSKNKKIVIFWFFLSCLYHLVALILGIGWEHRYFTIPAASLPFSTGALIFHYKDKCQLLLKRQSDNNHLPFLICFIIIANWYAGLVLDDSKGVFFYSNYLLCSLMIIALADRTSLPFMSKKLDNWLGDFSYPIYLLHYQVGLVIISTLALFEIMLLRPSIELMLITLPFLFLFSWLFTITIEKPIEAIRKKVKAK
jgi:peptidoglycan/LPS O-acetylase OafA/YrhL